LTGSIGVTVRASRPVVLLASVVLVLCGACRSSNENNVPTNSPAPTATSPVVSLGTFQIVGTVEHALVGIGPGIDVSGAVVQGASTTPEPSPVGTSPPQSGVVRLKIEDLSDDLAKSCDVSGDDVVLVFWTVDTRFDPPNMIDDIEDRIEGRTAGISGTIFRKPSAQEGLGAARGSALPAASPSPAVAGTQCVLVADQIGFTRTTLPTPRSTARSTAAPTRAVTTSPTPKTSSSSSATPSPSASTPSATP
jgi:hypothetical protein